MKYPVVFVSVLVSGVMCVASFNVPFGARTRMSRATLFYFPPNFDRAVECATKQGTCDVDELEKLAAELEDFERDETRGPYQNEEDFKETMAVKDLLEAQSKLERMTENYIEEHHKQKTAKLDDIF